MLNTLVVGLGARGRNILQENVLCAPDWNIVAAAEPSAECRKATTELMPELPLFADYGEALRETECDVVAVYTPGQMHGEHIAVALEAGRHVFVEKPFTLSHREAVDLTRLAEANKLKIAVGQNLRYLPLFRELRRKVAARNPSAAPATICAPSSLSAPVSGPRSKDVRSISRKPLTSRSTEAHPYPPAKTSCSSSLVSSPSCAAIVTSIVDDSPTSNDNSGPLRN
jgi:hypothetical protein